MRPHNDALGRPGEPDVVYATFIERIRNFLHIILCMSPVGDALRVRCRKFPSLVDCCTLNWFASWPEQALISVSTSILNEFNLPGQDFRNALADMCKEVHLSSQVLGH